MLWFTKNNDFFVFDETSKHQDRDSRFCILDQSEAMAGQGGGAGCEAFLCNHGDPKDVTDLVLDLLAGKLRRPIQREGSGFARGKGGARESLTVPAQSRTCTSMRTSLNKS